MPPPPIAPLPATRDGWIRLLQTALSAEAVPPGSFKTPLYFYPRVGRDGSVVTNWGRQSSSTQPGKKDAHTVRQSAVLMLLTPVEPVSAPSHSPPPQTVGTPADGSASPNTCNNGGGEGTVSDLVFTLTMRTGSLRSHSAQMAFPGGRSDKIITSEGPLLGRRVERHEEATVFGTDGKAGNSGDGAIEWTWEAAEDTASREALEEVGVPASGYTILGTLRPLYSTPSKSWVTPVVAIANPSAQTTCFAASAAFREPAVRPVIASPAEVASIHYMSLSSLLAHSNNTHHHNMRFYPFSTAMERAGGVVRSPSPSAAAAASSSSGGAAATSSPPQGHVDGRAALPINSGELVGFALPCFFAQDRDPFSPSEAATAVVGDTPLLYTGASGLPKGLGPAEVAAKEAARVVSGEVSAELSEANQSTVVMVGTTESGTNLSTPNTPQEGSDASPLPTKAGRPIPARCKDLRYAHEADAEGFTLVWGLTAFMLCEFIARVTAARLVLSGAWGTALSAAHPTDLTPLLSCSDVAVRDVSHPYGPAPRTQEAARKGEYVVASKAQL